MEMSVGFADKDETAMDKDDNDNYCLSDHDLLTKDVGGHDSPAKDSSGRGLTQYDVDESVLGKVYIPREGVAITGPICVRYERHPWIEAFEIDGIVALRLKRTGFGTKDIKGFVQSLNSIYAKAYDDYADYLVSDAASDFPDRSGVSDAASDFPDNPGYAKASSDIANAFDTSGYFAHVTENFVSRFKSENKNEGNGKMLKKYCGFVENMWREGNEEMCGVALSVVVPMLLKDEEARATFTSQITDEFRDALNSRRLL